MHSPSRRSAKALLLTGNGSMNIFQREGAAHPPTEILFVESTKHKTPNGIDASLHHGPS
jgi:hypothetical protein